MIRGVPNSSPAPDDVARAINQMVRSEVLNGRLLEGVQVAATAIQVMHGLGYTPRGVVVAGLDADARVWEPVGRTATTITLQASAPVTAALWVF